MSQSRQRLPKKEGKNIGDDSVAPKIGGHHVALLSPFFVAPWHELPALCLSYRTAGDEYGNMGHEEVANQHRLPLSAFPRRHFREDLYGPAWQHGP